MSLHLLESTNVQAAANRKRGGTAASVTLHALLVLGVFTAATAAPVPDEPTKPESVVYIAPPKLPTTKLTQTSNVPAAAAPSSRQPEFVLRAPDLTNIKIDMPAVKTDVTIDLSARDFSSRRGAVGGTGTAPDGNGGLGSGVGDLNAVLNDLQVEKTVVALSGYRTPRYPEAMRAMGVEETVNATFVVDTLGRIEAGSLDVPDAKHPQFVVAVREALANARFRPAEVHGRRVRQRVSQAFVFSLARN